MDIPRPSPIRIKRPRVAPVLLGLAALWAAGCAAQGDLREKPQDMRTGVDQFGNSMMDSFGNNSTFVPMAPSCAPDCQDFPAAPLFEAGAPTDAPQRFGAPDNFGGSGPCVLEPPLSEGDRPGAVFPTNWLRPRFRFEPLGGETLWEIRLQSERQANDLVAYTTTTTWTLPREIWEGLGRNGHDETITVTIRGLGSGGMPSGTRGTFEIAPVQARGKMVYWATTSSEVKPDTSKLAGFDVGDEAVIDALTIPQAGNRGIYSEGGRQLRSGSGVSDGYVQCIGCHVSTPDGGAVAFTDHWPWNNVLASVEQGTAGQAPSYVSPGAKMLLNQPWLGMQTFSGAQWAAGERVVVSAFTPRNGMRVGFTDSASYPSRTDTLVWIDLETTASFGGDPMQGDVQQQINNQVAAQLGSALGFIELQGETRSVAAPNFSHDGTKIIYTSADFTQDGRLSGNNSEVDLHVVPYNDGAGGPIAPVPGASEPGVAEYYPAFSADDRLIAFNRVARVDSAPMYYRPDGEVYVVPAEGGQAVRLLANDPPACSGERSPGVINSWPKWSPSVASVAATGAEFAKPPRSFYFLIFSSARAYPGRFDLPRTQYSPPDTRSSQLYMTVIVRDDKSGQLSTYPAVYLWNQDPTTSNLTPAWDEFKIPPVPPPD